MRYGPSPELGTAGVGRRQASALAACFNIVHILTHDRTDYHSISKHPENLVCVTPAGI
ncbi:uncharacterized protein L969DRAFT_53896 [Mixia osmundae IAM 14324]|uniref:Uncharacterized protein n=1 Tax=Mixia osmundae (strain CBS 9802 / IAM 14324 / JCM 22182 / KY 12970) TaxID=764103 RepID=G7EAW2_MIXOS|nr:uncharacterized protein L969DRAFT_53896 [Mixia osmundae IAM 14324]KEI37006.1 hypothetical protein L969DRAFT_53896 [Mixia osmundae IAM 14324]GAA99972.1 hypothetical protein E5Q_06675 [Mixia osmundae IAM 14324]